MSECLEILDLTKPMDDLLEPYTEGDYSDPKFQMSDWCSIAEQGYSCSKLTLGTQTGTHIDAPSHFVDGAATLDALPLTALMGRYHFVDLDSIYEQTLAGIGETARILFLTASADVIEISPKQFEALLMIDCPVWVIVCGIRVAGADPLYMHRALAEKGRYLVEDIELSVARQVGPGGEIIIFPMRLMNAVGAPCRVVVRQ